jgi:hypothetical protein
MTNTTTTIDPLMSIQQTKMSHVTTNRRVHQRFNESRPWILVVRCTVAVVWTVHNSHSILLANCPLMTLDVLFFPSRGQVSSKKQKCHITKTILKQGNFRIMVMVVRGDITKKVEVPFLVQDDLRPYHLGRTSDRCAEEAWTPHLDRVEEGCHRQ